MTDTPLDLDYIEHRMASPMVTYRESVEEDMPALVAALRKAEDALVSVGTEAQDWHAAAETYRARAEKAEAQVAAVLAECRKVATVSGNASGYPYVLVNTIVGAIERAS